jgi:hypothetical protein
LIELLGFHGTLRVGAACNGLIAVLALVVSRSARRKEVREVPQTKSERSEAATGEGSLLALLFATGLTSMGMEVVWVRQFTPYLGTVVYAFASILAVYLTGTFIGSRIYRRWSLRHSKESTLPWTLLALSALFPLVAASPSIVLYDWLRLVRQSRPGRESVCGERSGLHLGSVAGWLPASALDERALGAGAALGAVANPWRPRHSCNASGRTGARFRDACCVLSNVAGGIIALPDEPEL